MASVRKREWTHKGETKTAWVVNYTDQGGKRRLKTFYKKKEADAYRTTVEVEIEKGVHTPARETVTFGEAADAWCRHCEWRHKVGDRMAGSSLARNVSNCITLKKRLASKKLTEMNYVFCQEFVNGLHGVYQKRTIQGYVSILNSIMKFSVKKKWIKLSPTASEALHVPGVVRRKVIPSKAEIQVILAGLSSRAKRESQRGYQTRVVMVMLGLFAGLRRGEVAGLQWEDVCFAEGALKIRHSYSLKDGLKEPKTRAGERRITMTGHLFEALRWHHEWSGRPETGYVLTTRNGRHLGANNAYLFWCSHMMHVGMWIADPARAGIRKRRPDYISGRPQYTFHALRHAMVSLLIESGLPPFNIKDIVGHARLSTTMDVYGHLFPENDAGRRAMHAVSGQFSQPAPFLSMQQGCDKGA